MCGFLVYCIYAKANCMPDKFCGFSTAIRQFLNLLQLTVICILVMPARRWEQARLFSLDKGLNDEYKYSNSITVTCKEFLS